MTRLGRNTAAPRWARRGISRKMPVTIWLSPMNSGTTTPFAWPRGRATFKRIKSFPYTERKKYGQNAIAEVAVDGLVDGVEQMAESVVIRNSRRRVKTIWRP